MEVTSGRDYRGLEEAVGVGNHLHSFQRFHPAPDKILGVGLQVGEGNLVAAGGEHGCCRLLFCAGKLFLLAVEDTPGGVVVQIGAGDFHVHGGKVIAERSEREIDDRVQFFGLLTHHQGTAALDGIFGTADQSCGVEFGGEGGGSPGLAHGNPGGVDIRQGAGNRHGKSGRLVIHHFSIGIGALFGGLAAARKNKGCTHQYRK